MWAQQLTDWIVKLKRDLGTETETLDITSVEMIVVITP